MPQTRAATVNFNGSSPVVTTCSSSRAGEPVNGDQLIGVQSNVHHQRGAIMTVGIRIKLRGVTQEQFDEVHKHVDPAGNPPKGLQFHASGPIEDGWGVIDFWASRQDFDAFQPRIQEAATAAGVEMHGPPDVKEFPVHETFQP